MARQVLIPFDGSSFEAERDADRLHAQLARVRDVMADGRWRTLQEIHALTGAPEASISARLRDLRKPKFGGYVVERSYLHDGLFSYRVIQPERSAHDDVAAHG